ncbi:MAG: GNAT family N-acetyltransferase [Armatimonadota bacterium]
MILIDWARPADFDSLENLIEETFVETWSGLVDDEHIREHLTNGHARSVVDRFCRDIKSDIQVVRANDRLVGYAIGFCPDDHDSPRYYILGKLYLRSSVQGIGVGSRLWYRMIELGKASGADGITLTHYPLNSRASRFYNRLGLKKVDETIYRCGNGEYRDWVLAATWGDLELAASAKGVMAE